MTTQEIQYANFPKTDQLIHLLENDTVGYRLERFVAKERESLVDILKSESFRIEPNSGFDITQVLQNYNEILSPYIEFFAIGCVYSKPDSGFIWINFLEKIMRSQETKSNHQINISYYPAFALLSSAGIMSSFKDSWNIFSQLMSHRIAIPPDDYSIQPLCFYIAHEEFMKMQTQKTINGRDREKTPLLNHFYEYFFNTNNNYFLDEDQFLKIYMKYELVYSVYFAHIRKIHINREGSSIWFPRPRLSNRYIDSLFTNFIQEAEDKKSLWPPIADGIFEGNTEQFVSTTREVAAFASQYYYW